MALGDITVNLNLDGKDFELSIKNADNLVKQFGESVNGTSTSIDRQRRVVRRWANSVAEAVIGLNSFRELLDSTRYSLSLMVNPFIEANANLERMTVIMEGLAKEATSTEEAIRISGESVEYLMEMVRSAPFSMNALQNAFVKFRAAGIDPTNGSLQALVDSVAKFGGDDEMLNRASVAIQQMAGKGVVSMEELRQQLGEAVPEAMQLMADGLGLTMSELTKIVETGTLEAQGALDAMFNQMEMRNAGAAENMMSTWTGLVAQFRAYRDILLQEMGDAGLFDAVKTQLEDLVNVMKGDAAKVFAQEVGQALTQVVEVTRLVIDNFDTVMLIIKGIAAYMAANWARNVVTNLMKSDGAVAKLSNTMKNASGRVKDLAVGSAQFTKASVQANAVMVRSGQIFTTNAQKVKLSREEFIRYESATKRASASLGVMRGAVSGVGSALSALGGPIGIAIFAAWELANAFDVFGTKMDEIRQRAAEGILPVTNEEFQRLETEMANSISRIKELDEQLVKLQNRRTSSWGNAGIVNALSIEGISSELGRLQKEVEEAGIGLEQSLKLYQQTAARTFSQVIESEFRDTRTQLSRNYESLIREANEWKKTALEEQELSPTEIEAAYRERRASADMLLARELQSQKLALIKNSQEEAIARIENDKAMDDKVKKARIAGINQSAEELVLAANKAFREATERAEAGSTVSTFGGTDRFDIFTQRYKQALIDIAGMQAEINGQNIELAKTLQKAANVKVDSVGEEELRNVLARRFAAEQELKAKRTLETINDRIIKQEARLAVDAMKKSEENPYLKMSSGARQLNTEIEKSENLLTQWNNQVGVSDQQVGKLKNTINQLRDLLSAQTAVDLNNTVRQFKDMTREINDQMATQSVLNESRRQTAQETLANLEELKRAIKNSETLSEEAKTAMIQDVGEYGEAVSRLTDWMTRSALTRMFDDWLDTTKAMDEAWVFAFEGMSSELANLVVDGEANFDSLAKSFTKMITQMIIQWSMAKAAGFLGITGFEDGGVASSKGDVALKRYARGGIAKANNPQLAMYGEGSMNEAFVPLPDGRSIPVSMNGAAPSVEVNVINESGQEVNAEQRGSRMDGEKYILDVVLRATNRPGSFRQGMKGALS